MDTRSHDAAVHDQEIVDEEAHTNRKDNPETDKKSNTQSGKSKPKAKDTQKENRLSSKQKRYTCVYSCGIVLYTHILIFFEILKIQKTH